MYGSQYFGVLPNQQRNPLDFAMDLQQQQFQQQRYEEQLQQQQQRYQDGLLSDVADKLDFKHFATGTAFDPVFQQSLNATLKGVASKLKEGGNYTDALMLAMKGAGEIGAYAGKVKNIRKTAEDRTKLFDKDLSIDGGRLFKESLARALFKEDGSGLRDVTELDDQRDYAGEILTNKPELVTKGLGSLQDQIEKAKYIDYEADVEKDVGGVKRQLKYKGKYDPLYNELVNDKGEVVDANTGKATGLRVKGQPLTIGNQQVTGATDDVMAHYYQNPSIKAGVQGEAARMMDRMPPGTKREDVERAVLYGQLSKSANTFINKVKDGYDDSQLQAQQFREAMMAVAASNRASAKEGGTEAVNINDVVGRAVGRLGEKGVSPIKGLPIDDQSFWVETAKKLGVEGRNRDGYVTAIPTADDLEIINGTDGSPALALTEMGRRKFGRSGSYLGPIATTTNIKAQPSVKEKRAVLSGGSNAPTTKFKGVPQGGF